METAIKRYNRIMFDLCLEFNTIGTSYTEDPKERNNWNLRDLITECDYQLSTYTEWGHTNYEMRYSDDPDERKMWRSDTGKLERFINHYEPYTRGMKPFAGHCSKYD